MGVIRHGEFVLRVDPVLCDGFGHCHELAPELVDIDEWGYPIIRREPTPLADHQALRSARYAVRGCPRQALHIERVEVAAPARRPRSLLNNAL